VDALVVLGQAVEQLAGAVGRVVVDEQEVGEGDRGQEVLDHVLDVVALVVRRDDDQGGRGHARTITRVEVSAGS
jgi:hypothetical protein